MALPELIDDLFARPDGITLALVVAHRGEVVAERYGTQPENLFQPEIEITADSTLLSWSMAKSITHAAVGILVGDGLLDLGAPAPVPEWSGTAKADITTLQLLEMRSGLRFVEDYVDDSVSHCIEMLFGESGPSHAAYAAALPLDHEPGSVYNYSSGTTNIVARILGDIVAGGPGGEPDARRSAMETFLWSRLFEPAGMESAVPKFDAAGDFIGSTFVYATARDFLRFGELYRHDGVTASGRRILPEGWRDHARTWAAHDDDNGCDYGRHWWIWPEFAGSLCGHGHEGQYIVVVPDRELTIVHLGKTEADAQPELRALLREMVRQF
ncbi:MAG TPA: serine hydrolase domain-containing protein [Ilumatobacteraceae bacterium]|nr:serine hydrolase domain-containing protein [Ilumatobacteraceae bacterium]